MNISTTALSGSLLFGLFVAALPTTAQVTIDGTTSTTVNADGNNFEINNGNRAGDNLFHSFRDFSVPTGGEAFFNNANDIVNIFSRITGGNISNIDGLLRANGGASLFLINPAGIIFGNNARLDIGGSFYSSSASGILFEDGEFSATDLDNPPLLTINAPIGLNFRDNPEPIINRSFVQNDSGENVGLSVLPGNNLTLVGGNLNFEAGKATASGGNIELGGLSEAGIVSINPDGSLSFPENLARSNVLFSNGADVDARGMGGGNVTVNARNLELTAGEFGSSFIRTGIRPESTSAEAQAGDVTINVAENINLDDSRISNQVNTGGVGNSGNIFINTGSLEVINGGTVSASTFGEGDAGAVNITATGDINIDGEDPSDDRTVGGIFSTVGNGGKGNASDVIVNAENITLTNAGTINASTFGRGNAGQVTVNVNDTISIDGEDLEGFPSGIFSQVTSDAMGNARGITISTANLTLTKGGRVSASTFGQGNAGAVNITATGDLNFDGEDSDGSPSGIASRVNEGAVGNAAGVTISTVNLTLTNGGQVDASTFGEGDAGAVNITATGDINIDGEDPSDDRTVGGIFSTVGNGGKGNASDVIVNAENITLTNAGTINASTFGRGNAGQVTVNVNDTISTDGEDLEGFPSGIFSQVTSDAVGDAGGVTISTVNLTLTEGGLVAADTFGQGNAGAVNITATRDLNFDGEDSDGNPSGVTSLVTSDAVGDAGGITISTIRSNLTNGGRVSASTLGQGNAGGVKLLLREI